MPPRLSIADYAHREGISIGTVRRRIRAGTLPAVQEPLPLDQRRRNQSQTVRFEAGVDSGAAAPDGSASRSRVLAAKSNRRISASS